MKIGIGLPNSVRGATGKVIVEWARRAEARGFSSLGTIGRIAFPAYGELVALAAAAGATQRIGLVTDILLGPVYNPVLLARDAASLDQLSGGRFILGASVGARKDDYDITHQDYSARGRRWDEALELMHKIWRGEPPPGTDQPVGPRPTNGSTGSALGVRAPEPGLGAAPGRGGIRGLLCGVSPDTGTTPAAWPLQLRQEFSP